MHATERRERGDSRLETLIERRRWKEGGGREKVAGLEREKSKRE